MNNEQAHLRRGIRSALRCLVNFCIIGVLLGSNTSLAMAESSKDQRGRIAYDDFTGTRQPYIQNISPTKLNSLELTRLAAFPKRSTKPPELRLRSCKDAAGERILRQSSGPPGAEAKWSGLKHTSRCLRKAASRCSRIKPGRFRS
jgi:hypothetical protein